MTSNDKEERPALEQKPTPENNNTDQEQELLKSRRKALGKILAAGGVIAGAHFIPSKWTAPVVNSIIVPAHAQTSGPGIVSATTNHGVTFVLACEDEGTTIITIVGQNTHFNQATTSVGSFSQPVLSTMISVTDQTHMTVTVQVSESATIGAYFNFKITTGSEQVNVTNLLTVGECESMSFPAKGK